MVAETSGQVVDGETVYVYDWKKKFLGSAIYNSASKIRARLFSLDRCAFDAGYVVAALKAAIGRRLAMFDAADSFRVAYSDADFLPGVIADKIGPYLIIQLLTLAADRRAGVIVQTLEDVFSLDGVVVVRDTNVRTKEGLALEKHEIRGHVPEVVTVSQDGYHLCADLIGGQKTGLFLDQRFNRRLLAPFCRGKRVLDLFCHTGAWAFTAAAAGASEVVGVDSSESAIALASKGAELNGFEQVSFREDDVFDFMAAQGSGQFDAIVCDPPAFAKTRRHVPEAVRAYLSLNYRAMKLLPVGGILATCSCSHYVTPDEFDKMLQMAARNARMQFQVVSRGGQSPDHPILLGFSESEYLKCVLLRRVQ